MQERYAQLIFDFAGVHDPGNHRIPVFPGTVDPYLLGQRSRDSNRKACISYHRFQLHPGGFFADDAGVLSGDRRRGNQYVSVTVSADRMSGADLLAILADRTGLYVVFLPGIRSAGRRNRADIVLPDLSKVEGEED